MLFKHGVNNGASGHHLAHLINWSNEFALLEVTVIDREELLEKGCKDGQSVLVEFCWHSFLVDVVRLVLLRSDSVPVSTEPRFHIWFPTNI